MNQRPRPPPAPPPPGRPESFVFPLFPANDVQIGRPGGTGRPQKKDHAGESGGGAREVGPRDTRRWQRAEFTRRVSQPGNLRSSQRIPGIIRLDRAELIRTEHRRALRRSSRNNLLQRWKLAAK